MISTDPPDRLLRRLNWTVLKPLAHALGGNERSLVRGPGMELDELREYQPGDDVRHIDWNITARADTPYVRQSRVERALDVWLLLDVSASVDWGTAKCLKRDRAIEFAAVTGSVLGRHGNRLGALLFADRPLGFVPPASGRLHLMRLLGGMREAAQQSSRGETDLAAALNRAGSVIRRKALVIVASDFIAPDGWQPTLRQMAQRHDVVAAHISDPRERDLPDVGLLTLEDPETGRQLIVNTGDGKLRQRFAQAAQAQAERVRADVQASGASYLALSTDEDLLPAMVRFLNARKVRRGQRLVIGKP
jgi:uncharacterized protein (DUF58 family)